MNWDKATDIILLSSLAVLAIFVVMGICQWIKRKSLKKVDKEILWMPLPLALMVVVYFVFDKIWILNTRPDGSGEASFPSTHVMVTATILSLVALVIPKYIKSNVARVILYLFILAFIILVSVGRVLANKHWPSDVIGALGFSAFFAIVYYLTAIRRSKNV